MQAPLRIVHVFRDPVGGIFRHVRDLVSEQSKAGHEVGIICDSTTGGEYEAKLFETIKPQLSLGLHRTPMTRSISPRDLISTYQAYSIIKNMRPNIVHCHSAKGGVYGRLAAKLNNSRSAPIKAFYCPHGGAMHYGKHSLKGRVFFTAERLLERFTDSLIFVSGYEQSAYHEKVGRPSCAQAIVFNGLAEDEFLPVVADDNASDFLYIGMKRDLKGPDVFLEAIAIARKQSGINITAQFVGDGPDEAKYHSQISNLGLKDSVQEKNAMPAREAFKLAKIVVVPSRAESMPYLVLEAIAAQKPIICTNVGGIPEIYGDANNELVEPSNATALANAMLTKLDDQDLQENAKAMAEKLKTNFSLAAMASNMEKTYRA